MKLSSPGRRFRLVVACGLLVAPLVASMAEAEIKDWTFRQLNPVDMPEGGPATIRSCTRVRRSMSCSNRQRRSGGMQ